MRSASIVLIFLGLSFSCWAQPISKPKYEELVAFAQELFEKKDYFNALEKFQEAYDDKNEQELILPIAKLHFLLRDYDKAERWYSRLLDKDKEGKYAENRFEYGRALKMNGVYDEAIPQLERFVNETTNDSLRQLAQIEIAGAQLALELPKNSSSVEISNLGKEVNTSFSEYSPAIGRGGNELYFAAFDTKGVIVIDDPGNDKIYSKIYQVSKKEDGWDKPKLLDPKINRPGVHNSYVSISPDGNTMFITRAVLRGNELEHSKIYYCVGGEGAWGAANEVQGVNGDYLAKDPVAGELFGKEVLFFAANIPGGYGGFDIYYATRTGEGTYSDPVNLGNVINTIGDDETPFYFNGTLYFSSTGHPSLGGFDIFYSAWNGTTWSDPANMGAGFNTSVDDHYFYLSEDGYKGFLTSNRGEDGGRSTHGKTCCDDIYAFEIAKLYADLVAGVFDEKKQVIKGATVELVKMQNNVRGLPEAKTNPNGNRFDFGLELENAYMVIARKDGYFPDSVAFNTVGITESKTIQQLFFLKAKPVPIPEPEYDTISIEEAIVLENILYDYDDDRIKLEAETDLQVVYELMTEYPDMKIELSSHTDNRGNNDYNEDLSQRRAESARRWLVRKGIVRERIEAEGYGENAPKAVSKKFATIYSFLKEGDLLTQSYIDSLSNEEEKEAAHSINRRTEFKIIEGPTSITIKRTRLKKNETKPAPRRNALPRASVSGDTLKIDKLSSLYGKKSLKGVPVMQFKERTIDFGKVPKGEKRYHIYEFVNKGDTDLVISTHVACECTTVDYSTRPVKPGQKGEIDVTFDSTEKDGEELIEFELILENTIPGSDEPIIEKLQYKFIVVEKQ